MQSGPGSEGGRRATLLRSGRWVVFPTFAIAVVLVVLVAALASIPSGEGLVRSWWGSTALGLLMLASTLDHRLADLVTYDDIAQELVGIAVASIGLVLAIPLTTGIAAALVGSPRVSARVHEGGGTHAHGAHEDDANSGAPYEGVGDGAGDGAGTDDVRPSPVPRH